VCVRVCGHTLPCFSHLCWIFQSYFGLWVFLAVFLFFIFLFIFYFLFLFLFFLGGGGGTAGPELWLGVLLGRETWGLSLGSLSFPSLLHPFLLLPLSITDYPTFVLHSPPSNAPPNPVDFRASPPTRTHFEWGDQVALLCICS
jgi:hypothetical protein